MRDEEKVNIMSDLKKRAEALKAEPATNIYKKALKWQELALEAIERVEAMQRSLDCEDSMLGEPGKVDIRRFTCRRFYDETPAGLDSPSHNAHPVCAGT
jgi:hypothetical protein